VPIYEYACRQCGRRFEELVFGQAPTPSCPGCQTADVERLLSAAVVGRSGADSAPVSASCGSCGDPRGPGACARN
jgi:putative FmdB family regulatory protein